jgi:hypothetical protein
MVQASRLSQHNLLFGKCLAPDMKPVPSHAVDKVRVAFHQLNGSLAGRHFENPQAAYKCASRFIAKTAGYKDLCFMGAQVREVRRLVSLTDLLHFLCVLKDGYPAHVSSAICFASRSITSDSK